MELKLDKTTKILLGAIALGLFLNAVPVVNAEWVENAANSPLYIHCVSGCGST